MNKFLCWFLGHDWTSKANKGIFPTKEELDQGVPGFYHYSTMYCDRCGHISKLNKELTGGLHR